MRNSDSDMVWSLEMVMKVVQFEPRPYKPTDEELIGAIEALIEIREKAGKLGGIDMSVEHAKQIVRLARAGLAERQTRPA